MLSNGFSVAIESIIWFLSFTLLMWCITFTDLYMLNYLCIPGINPTSFWCMRLLMYYWIEFPSILSRIFTPIFIGPWRRKWQPSPVFLPGESHGQRRLMGYTVHSITKSRTRLKQLSMHTHTHSSGILACMFLFLKCLRLPVACGYCWPHKMSLGVSAPLQFFLKSLRKISIHSCKNTW